MVILYFENNEAGLKSGGISSGTGCSVLDPPPPPPQMLFNKQTNIGNDYIKMPRAGQNLKLHYHKGDHSHQTIGVNQLSFYRKSILG